MKCFFPATKNLVFQKLPGASLLGFWIIPMDVPAGCHIPINVPTYSVSNKHQPKPLEPKLSFYFELDPSSFFTISLSLVLHDLPHCKMFEVNQLKHAFVWPSQLFAFNIWCKQKLIALFNKQKCKIGRDWNLIAGNTVVKGNQKWRWIVGDQSGKRQSRGKRGVTQQRAP